MCAVLRVTITRTIALAARVLSEADVLVFARDDRGPCILECPGVPISKAGILAKVTSEANAAILRFVRGLFKKSLMHIRVITALPTVTHRWITEPAQQHAQVFRLRARARPGLANVNAYRQPRGDNPRRNCRHCGCVETLAHMFAGCARFLTHYRRRHNDSAAVVLECLADALGGPFRCHVRRERALESAVSVPEEAERLRSDTYLIDSDRGLITPIEFTFPDDANLADKI